MLHVQSYREKGLLQIFQKKKNGRNEGSVEGRVRGKEGKKEKEEACNF